MPAPAIVEGDVIIRCFPPCSVEWFGTRAQLQAELPNIPADQWDIPSDWRGGWEESPYEYRLGRILPDGMPRRPRAERDHIDYWHLARYDTRYRKGEGWSAAIYRNRVEHEYLQRRLAASMSGGPSFFSQHSEAERDERFQELIQRVLTAEPCASPAMPSVAETVAKHDVAVARLRRESRRAKGDPDATAA